MSEHTSEELLTHFLETRDKDALGILYERFQANMIGLAYKMVGNQQDAEDIVNDVFYKLYEIEAQEIKSAVAFLDTLVKWQCRAHLKEKNVKGRREQVSLDSLKDKGVSAPDLLSSSQSIQTEDGEVKISEIWPDIEDALDTLSPDERHIVQLHYCRDMTGSQISTITGLHADNVESLMRRGIIKIRHYLGIPNHHRQCKPIQAQDPETERIVYNFASIRDAIRAGFEKHRIYRSLKEGKAYKQLIWTYTNAS